MPPSQRRVGSEFTDVGDSLIQISTENSVGRVYSSGCEEVAESVGTHAAVTKRNRFEEEREEHRRRRRACKFEQDCQVRIAERTRIARELHDTLLQSFPSVLMQLQTVRNLLPTQSAEARAILRNAIDQAKEAVTEGRKAVQGLRTPVGGRKDLAATIEALGEMLAADPGTSHGVSLRVYVVGTARPLHPVVRHEIYRIAEEALRNAFQHSQGSQIQVEVRYDKPRFRLRVCDNGKGIDASVTADRGRDAHFGLFGMRERAALIGGQFSVWSGPDSGTEIELSMAASRVYATSRAARSTVTPSGATPTGRIAPECGSAHYSRATRQKVLSPQ